MTVKFINVTQMLQRLQYVLNIPISQIKCYNVTVLQPIHGLKTRKYLNYHKLFSCILKVYWLLHLCYNSYSAFFICPLYESSVTVLQPINANKSKLISAILWLL